MESLALEDFDLNDVTDPVSGAATSPAVLDTYDAGYRAGWEDAVAAQTADISRLRGELGQTLRDLGFSHEQARAEVLRQVEPVLRAMAEKVLPELARRSIAPLVVEKMLGLARDLTAGTIEISLHPDNVALVDRLTDHLGPARPRLVARPSLGMGQAVLLGAGVETLVDLDGVLDAVSVAMAAYSDHSEDAREPDSAHG